MTSLLNKAWVEKFFNNINHFLLCSAFDNQSIAWSSPSPFVAEVLKIWNVLFLRASNPSA